MGVEGEKSSLLRQLIMQAECENLSVTLTDEEWQQVERMAQWVANGVENALEHEGHVSQNVLEYAMAVVVGLVMKLNAGMFGEVGGEADHMAVLIRHVWKAVKDKEIDYKA